MTTQDDAITDAIAAPKEIEVTATGSIVTEHSLGDMVKAAEYLNRQVGKSRTHGGVAMKQINILRPGQS